jgi:glycosyltransferase involved in cell wall biosynthesis
MRIVQVVPNFPPYIAGDGVHVYNISKELVKRGHDVTVLTISSTRLGVKETEILERETVNGVNVQRFPSFYKNWYFLFSPKLIAFLRKENYDLVHCHKYFSLSSFPSGLVVKLRKKPFVFTAHSPTMARYKSTPLATLKRIYDSTFGYHLFRMADKLIALTPDNVTDYIRMGADPRKIRVVPNGIDLDKFTNLPNPSAFKKKHDIHGKVVLFVGRLAEHKGVQYLLYAMPKILEDFPNAKCVIIGPDYGYIKKLIKIAEKLKISESIIFTGQISDEDLLKAYSAADVFVLPSRHEGFSIVLLEAMACRKPVITWRTSAMQYVVKDGETGFLVNPWQLAALTEAIRSLLSNKKLANVMGENGRKLVESEFTWKKVVDILEAVYEEVLNRQNRM